MVKKTDEFYDLKSQEKYSIKFNCSMPNSELIGLAPTTITGLNRLGYFWCRHQEFSIDSLNQRSTYHFAEKSKYMYMAHIIWALLSINYPV